MNLKKELLKVKASLEKSEETTCKAWQAGDAFYKAASTEWKLSLSGSEFKDKLEDLNGVWRRISDAMNELEELLDNE